MKSICIIASFVLIFVTITATAQNRVLQLDGDGDYVQLPSSIFNDLDEATIEAWLKWERFGLWSQPFGFGSSDEWRIMVVNNCEGSPDLQFFIYIGSEELHLVKVKNLLLLNQWLHIAAVSGKNGMKLYLNGVLVGENDYTGSFSAINNNDYNYFGKSQWDVNADFKGQLDSIRLWKVARTGEQIRDSMFKKLTGNEDGLVGLWNFDSGDARDLSKNGYSGLMFGDACCVEVQLPSPGDLVPALSGKITDEAGNPLANAKVYLQQDGKTSKDTTTDDAGNYGMIVFPPGRYDLCAEWYDKGHWRQRIHLPAGEQRILNLTLKPNISISGTLLTWDNTPHADVTVQVVQRNESTEMPQVIATTLSVKKLRITNYELQNWKEIWPPPNFGNCELTNYELPKSEKRGEACASGFAFTFFLPA